MRHAARRLTKEIVLHLVKLVDPSGQTVNANGKPAPLIPWKDGKGGHCPVFHLVI